MIGRDCFPWWFFRFSRALARLPPAAATLQSLTLAPRRGSGLFSLSPRIRLWIS